MVTVPERIDPLFAAAETVTVPDPLPEVPLVTVRKLVLLAAVQLQPEPCVFVTVKVVVLPLAPTLVLIGDTLNTHAGAAWLTVTLFPAIVTVPEREAPMLAAADTVTVPDPVPELPLVTVRKLVLLAAVQLQPVPCVFVTVKVVLPPPAATLALAGVTL
jgi:hypothetical protein